MFNPMGQSNPQDLGNGGVIDGTLQITGDLQVDGGGSLSFDEIIEGTQQIKVTDPVALLVEKADGTDIFTVNTTNSRVNVGTPTGTGIFEVEGTVDNDYAGRFENKHSGGYGGLFKVAGTTSGELVLQARASSTNILTVLGNSTVGIGTASPDTLLHLYSTSASKPILKIENEQGGANPVSIQMLRNTSSPADDDFIGQIDFRSMNDAGTPEEILYAYISAQSTDISDGTEDGEINFHTMKAGTLTNTLELKSGNATFAGDVNISSGKNINFSPSVYTSAVQGIKFDQDGGTTDSIIQPVRLTGNSGVIIYLGSNSFVNTSGGSDRYNDSNASSAIEVRPEGQIRFLTGGTGADPTEKMNINSDGTVGIGIDSPGEKLAVANGNIEAIMTTAGSGLRVIVDRVDTSDYAGFEARTGGNQKWFVGLRETGDDSLHFYDSSKDVLILDGNSRISLSNNDTGTSNTIFGKTAGDSDGAGDFNVFVGELSGGTGTQTDDADGNVGVGYRALTDVTSGNQNIALGKDALTNITSGDSNIGIGSDALGTATSAEDIIAIGRNAGYAVNSDGADGTVAIGRNALTSLTAGEANVAVGYQALSAEDDGSKSTAVGYQALTAQTGTTGTVGNVAIGYQAGNNITTGIENTIIGAFSTIGAVNGQNQIVIGNGVSGEGDNKAVIGNVSITDVYMAKDSGATVHADKYMSTTMPAFQAIPSAAQNNIAINTAVTIVLGTEIFDQGSNFASNTFTAPVTGKYQLNANVRFIDIDSAADYYYMWIVTSNRTYTHTIFDPDFGQDAAYWSLSFSVLADMDASDTAYVALYQGGGTQQTDIAVGAGETIFSGYLVC